MKKLKNCFPSFWVKVIPMMLILFSIGVSRTHAQNYKPLNEAMTSVQTALTDLKGPKIVGQTLNQSTPGAQKTNGMTPTQAAASNVKVFETSYYERFLVQAKTNNDVAAAMAALDGEFPTSGQQGSRNAIVTSARLDLLHLITY